MADQLLTIGRVPPSQASVAQTLELAQRIATDHLRLLQLDLEARVKRTLRWSAWFGLGALCLLMAWLGLLGAAAFALAERIPWYSSLLVVAGSQLLIGVALIARASWGRART